MKRVMMANGKGFVAVVDDYRTLAEALRCASTLHRQRPALLVWIEESA